MYDTSYAEEAGIKSTTFAIKAPYAYGTLRGEHGTHRMVRISKYDNQGRRQTSFAGVDVLPVVQQADHIEIPEDEIRVDAFRSSGPGGQGVNTTDSAAGFTHLPTGIVVSCQNERSQIQNRASAMAVLQAKLLERKREEQAAKLNELRGEGRAELGHPDPQLRAAPVPEHQGPADRLRDREHRRGHGRRDRRVHRGRDSLAAPAKPVARVTQCARFMAATASSTRTRAAATDKRQAEAVAVVVHMLDGIRGTPGTVLPRPGPAHWAQIRCSQLI